MQTSATTGYPARFDVDYPEQLDRVSTLLRVFYLIPIVILLAILSSETTTQYVTEAGEEVTQTSGGIASSLAVATALMIVFRQRYPRWWFDFALEFNRFAHRVAAYAALLTDEYPSTVEQQRVHLDVDYPNDVKQDLNRWLPLVKWLLAIPHIIVLAFLVLGALLAVIVAWFAILITGRYPQALFDYVVGVMRWGLRVQAYATLLVTDRYPPFSLSA
jgi:hypothetical protein